MSTLTFWKETKLQHVDLCFESRKKSVEHLLLFLLLATTSTNDRFENNHNHYNSNSSSRLVVLIVAIIIRRIILRENKDKDKSNARASRSSSSRKRKRHECSRGTGRLCAMAFTASPVEHLLIVIRERITDQLASEGHSEDIRVQADQLAFGLWSGQTADVVLSEVREVLPRQEFLGILAFCSDKYPLLYASLPADINGNNAQPVQWSFIQSGQNVQQISWPQHVPKAE